MTEEFIYTPHRYVYSISQGDLMIQKTTQKARHLLSLSDLSSEELEEIITLAQTVKARPEKFRDILSRKTLIMLFQKTSTRTRLSFEAGMTRLGGHAIFFDWAKSNYTLGSLRDETKCLARYGTIIMARVHKHTDLETMAAVLDVPLINALSDRFHPCQCLADLQTIKEHKGTLKGLKLAYIGDGNNVCHSLLLGGTKVGMEIIVAGPKKYWPDTNVVGEARKHGKVTLLENPAQAVKDADVVYTDTWVSMGQEEETKERLKAFKPYQVNKALLGDSDAIIMHCLPAHRGFEISDDVLDSENSVVFDQAENRMHAQNALMLFLLGKV